MSCGPYDLEGATIIRDFGGAPELRRCYEWHDANGRFHRDDGPAVIYTHPDTGETTAAMWFHHGANHRVGGPATEDAGGDLWYLWGHQVTEDAHDLLAMLPAEALAVAERLMGEWPEGQALEIVDVAARALAEACMPPPTQ